MSSGDCPPRHLFIDGKPCLSFKALYTSNYNKNNNNIVSLHMTMYLWAISVSIILRCTYTYRYECMTLKTLHTIISYTYFKKFSNFFFICGWLTVIIFLRQLKLKMRKMSSTKSLLKIDSLNLIALYITYMYIKCPKFNHTHIHYIIYDESLDMNQEIIQYFICFISETKHTKWSEKILKFLF